MKKEKILPIHPGEILDEEFLKPMGLNRYRLAKNIKISEKQIDEIISGMGRITPDIAIRLALHFNMSSKFWLGLQMDYDLDMATDQLLDKISKEVIACKVAA
jgi:addiction module HigA family antidote